MAKQAKKSAFLSSFDGYDDAVKQASNVVRNAIVTDEEIIEAFDLKPDQQVVVKCRLSTAAARLHDDKSKDKEGLPYILIGYTVMDEPGKGLRLSRFIPCYNRDSLEVDAEAMEEVWREVQGLGYDTKGMDASKLEEILEALTSSRPLVMVRINCAKTKTGPNRGKLRVYIGAQRKVEDADVEDDDLVEDDGTVHDAPPTPPPAKPKAEKPASKKAAPKPAPVEVDDEDEDEDEDDTPSFKKGDKIKITLEDDDGEEVEEQGVIVSVDTDAETATIKIGKEIYEDVDLEDLTKI